MDMDHGSIFLTPLDTAFTSMFEEQPPTGKEESMSDGVYKADGNRLLYGDREVAIIVYCSKTTSTSDYERVEIAQNIAKQLNSMKIIDKKKKEEINDLKKYIEDALEDIEKSLETQSVEQTMEMLCRYKNDLSIFLRNVSEAVTYCNQPTQQNTIKE